MTNRRMRFEFARLAGAGMLSPMNRSSRTPAHPLMAKIHQLFSRDPALANDYLRQENQILRGKLGSRVPLTDADRRILKTPPHAPLCNAPAERHIREIRETLDRLILLGEPRLRPALSELEEHHNALRPHQGIGNVIPPGFDYPAEPALPAGVQCEEVLGGLLNHYSIKKAA